MLENGNFELGTWTRLTHTGQEYGEIFVPTGWTAFWKEGLPVPHDPTNTNGYGRPEMHVIEAVPPFLDPPRIHSGNWAVKFFTFFRIHDAGIYQRVAVTPGQRLRVDGWAHAWSSNNDNPRVSDIDGDGINNFTFTVGIDPTGATDPWGNTVVWSDGAHIYDTYGKIPAVEATATAGFVTVFVRSQVLWPFKHCDAYIDDIVLTVLDDPFPIGTVPYYNREKYTKRVLVPPQDCTKKRWQEISGIAYDQRSTVSGSLDDALGHEPDQEVLALVYDLPPSLHPSYLEFRDTFYPGAEIEFVNAPPIPPTGYNYPVVETGTKLHPHGIGEPYDVLNRMVQQGHPLPYCKILAANPNEVLAVRNLKQLSPTTKFVCRLMRVPGSGINIEGPDFNSNPQDYMNALLPTMRAYPEVTYWELWNEQDPPEIAGHVKLAMFAKACAEIAHAEGIKLALLSYSMGVPEQDEWQAIYDTGLFQTMIDGGDILSLHAYGRTTDPISLEYVLLRHRWLYNYILIPNNRVVPYIMTEYSIDESSPGVGITDWSTEDLLAEYKRYDTFLAEEYYCLGASVYKFGIGEHYRHDNIWEAFTDLLYSVRDRQNAIPIGNQSKFIDVRTQLATNPNSPWYPWKKRAIDKITHVFVHHSAGASSSSLDTVKAIANYHTSLTGKNRPGICYTYCIGADGTVWYVSDIENIVFSQGSVEHPGDENLWGVGVCLLGNFTNKREPTAKQIIALEGIIEFLESALSHKLIVWGHKDVIGTQCPGDSWPFKPKWGKAVPTPSPLLIGFNDHPGATGTASDWMRANNLPGLIVRPIFLGGSGSALDFSQAAAAGQRVIVNGRYSWSVDMGGAGTMPRVGSPDWQPHVDAMIFTINNSVGVWGWELWNEMNNPREFPVTGALTPADVSITYNAIRAGCPGKRLAIGALDPFNAQAGDPRDWLIDIYEAITDVDFVTAHGYIRGPDADLVGSTAKFSDWPLTWQYLNYPLCCTELLSYLPDPYKFKPRYFTEFNHLWKTVEGDWGWVNDQRASAVITRAIEAASGVGFAGLAAYRWAGDAWTLEHNSEVLNAVSDAIR